MHSDETAIVPYLRGELGEAERRVLEAHLGACGECRATADDFRAILGRLAQTAPAPPAIHWGRYRAELREKLDRRVGGPRTIRRWWPASVALASAVAGVLLFLSVQESRQTRVADLGVVEETVIGGRLDLLQQYPVIERLDLLEDLEIIRNLDGLAPVKKG